MDSTVKGMSEAVISLLFCQLVSGERTWTDIIANILSYGDYADKVMQALKLFESVLSIRGKIKSETT